MLTATHALFDAASQATPSIAPVTKTPIGAEFDCGQCGAVVTKVGPNQRLCVLCRDANYRVRREARKIARRVSGKGIGDRDACDDCGSEYIRTAGMQKYCCLCTDKRRKPSAPVGSMIQCDICSKIIEKVGRTQKRCIGCRQEYYRQRCRDRSKSGARIGDRMQCARCSVEIVRTHSGTRVCGSCGANRMRKKRMAEARKADGQRVLIGEPISCCDCGDSVARRSASHCRCDSCSQERRREMGRRKAASGRLRRGLLPVKGSERHCEQCQQPFVVRSHKHRYCGTCAPSLWKTDPTKRLNLAVGNAIRKHLGKLKAGRRWRELLDFSPEQLKTHIERQFSAGMMWANFGEWHIDHILPLSSFSFSGTDDPEFKAAWSLTNLRPLWAPENLSKQARRTLLL